MMRVLKYFLYTLFLPLWWLQRLIPRNGNVWVFGSWYGNRHADNSRSLFLYVLENHPKIKPVWITRNRDVLEKVREEVRSVYRANSLKGIYYSLRAKNVFISSGKRDINPFFIHGANWIQLWHGSPFKKIGLDDKYATTNSFFQKVVVKNVFPFASELNYHRIVSNAPFFSPILASAFGVPLSQIMETGSPRNDVFFEEGRHAFTLELRTKFPQCKIVYYLPTFRGKQGVNSMFDLPDYDEVRLIQFLEEKNIVFVSKGHYIDNKVSGKKGNHERLIHLTDEKVTDINAMLKDADLLITDYSSIYFDFLLTEKPVIFAAFDLEEYISGNRELPFDYKDVTAGPIVKDWAALYGVLTYIWERPGHVKGLHAKNKRFNKYHDKENSKRVYEAIRQL